MFSTPGSRSGGARTRRYNTMEGSPSDISGAAGPEGWVVDQYGNIEGRRLSAEPNGYRFLMRGGTWTGYIADACQPGLPYFLTNAIAGSRAAPTYVTNGQTLGAFYINSYDRQSNASAALYAVAAENHSSITKGTQLRLATTPFNATAAVDRVFLEQNGTLSCMPGAPDPTQGIDTFAIQLGGGGSAFGGGIGWSDGGNGDVGMWTSTNGAELNIGYATSHGAALTSTYLFNKNGQITIQNGSTAAGLLMYDQTQSGHWWDLAAANDVFNIVNALNGSLSVSYAAQARVGINNTSPGRTFHPRLDDTNNNGIGYVLQISHSTSGTPAANIGVGMEFEVETAAGNLEIGATIEATATTVTAAAEQFEINFKQMIAGAAPVQTARLMGGSNNGSLELICTDGGTQGAKLRTYHQGGSQAVNDYPGGWRAYGQNSTPAQFLYSEILTKATNVTAGSEAAQIEIWPTTGGAEVNTVQFQGNKTVYVKAVVENPVTLTDGATVSLDASLGNVFDLVAAGNRTINAPTNASDGQKIVIRHNASGGARTLSLTTGSAGAFRFGTDITALTATTSGLTDYIGAIYNGAASRWDVVSYVKGF